MKMRDVIDIVEGEVVPFVRPEKKAESALTEPRKPSTFQHGDWVMVKGPNMDKPRIGQIISKLDVRPAHVYRVRLQDGTERRVLFTNLSHINR